MSKQRVEVVGHRVLLKPDFIKDETEWGFKLDVGEDHKREKAAVVIGTIVGIGPTAWKDIGSGEPWCKMGDVIHFAKYAGKFITVNGEDYVIINDEDCQAIIHTVEDE